MSKFTEITPEHLRCSFSASCPSVFRSDDGTKYRVTGEFIPSIHSDTTEVTVEIDTKLVNEALGVPALEAKIIEQANRIRVLEEINHNLGEAVRKSPIPWAHEKGVSASPPGSREQSLQEQALPSGLRSLSQWQPIETATKAPYEEILVLVNDYEDKELVHRIAMWDPENDDWTVFMANLDAEPVYWMPLLAAPEAKEASSHISPIQTPETPS